MSQTSPWITTASEETFGQEVIERSKTVPVVVDFWAPWCAPCRLLTPNLEAAIEDRQGKVHLVKVNTDECRRLAEAHGIRGIPNVKVFVKGEVVGELVGLQDRRRIDLLLDSLVPSDEQRALKEAGDLLLRGELDRVDTLAEPLTRSPRHQDMATLLLAEAAERRGDLDRAADLAGRITEGTEAFERARPLKLRLLFARELARWGSEAACRARLAEAPSDPEARLGLAAALTLSGRHVEALEELLTLLQEHRTFRDGIAHQAMLALFEELGADSDLVREYRRKLQIYL